jgi:hypothetical protein
MPLFLLGAMRDKFPSAFIAVSTMTECLKMRVQAPLVGHPFLCQPSDPESHPPQFAIPIAYTLS